MGFWGIEVKPGTPQPYYPRSETGKLHVTQATLGAGLGKEKSVIQCTIGDGNPIYLCSLLPNKIECCPLNLEFDDDDESVQFSVTGDRSIHLSGFLETYEEEYEQDEDDSSDGIDIGESGSEESSDYDSEEDHMDELEDFLDSNLEMYRKSSVPKSGVVIEEIEDEDKPSRDNKTERPKKKGQASDDENAKKQIIARESAQMQTGNVTVNNTMSESAKTPDQSSKKKNKNKKKNSDEAATEENKTSSSNVEKQTELDSKSSQVRTYPSGLIVEELSMGKPNGKKAGPGKQVAVRYIGKLQKNGKIFDSNIGKSPFKFRLGVGQVIKGWDVGVNGMRVGDKRKLTIPPSMGYGSQGAGGQIPPNAWLMFDVELINVQ